MIIVPAGVPHWFSSIDGAIRYSVVRVDPDNFCPPNRDIISLCKICRQIGRFHVCSLVCARNADCLPARFP